MSNRKIQMIMELDFTSKKHSLTSIQKDIESIKSTIDVNLDETAAEKLKEDVDILGVALTNSLNRSTGQVNFKQLQNGLENNHIVIDKFNKSLHSAGVDGRKSFNDMAQANQYLQGELKKSDNILTRMGTTLANTIRWNISASVVNATTGAFREMYFYAKDLDRALTDIRIVSGESASNMERFAIAANKSAKELGISTLDYAAAATLFYQQGLRGNDVLNMTEASIMAANITGESAAEMSNLLTAVMNGYKIATEDVLSVTDKLAAVGATTAADFNELATAMSKVASMANAAGVPLDSLNAQLATIVSVTREAPESIGTSLKTIYGRMLMFKNNTKDVMKDEDGELFGAPSVEKALQAFSRATGAQLSLFRTTADGKRELRDLGEVIEDIGDSWDKTTDKTAKFGLATALAGSRQQNRLIALFDSWDMYREAMETSLNAEGTTLEQNSLYMESYEGRIKQLQAAKEELFMTLMNTDGLKDFISALTKGVELITKIAGMTGGIYGAIGLIGSTLASMGTMKIFDNIDKISGLGKREDFTSKLEGDEAKQAQALLTIERTLGQERAERARQDMVNARNKRHEYSVQLQDLKAEQTNLLKLDKILQDQNETHNRKQANIQGYIKLNDEMGVSNERLNEVVSLYSNIEVAQGELIAATAENNKSQTEESQQKVDALKAKVEELKADIRSIKEEIDSDITTTGKNLTTSKGNESGTQQQLLNTAKTGEQLQKTIFGIQTVLMTMPAIINTINDETKTTTDVLKTAGTVAVPAVLNGLVKFGPVIAKSAAEAGGFLKYLSLAGPVAALVGAALAVTLVVIKQMTDEAKAFQIAFNKMEEASGNLAQAEGAYANLQSQIDALTLKQKELNDLGNFTPDVTAELQGISEKLILLEQEKVLQEFLMKMEREKAHLAAMTALEETRKSELIKDGFRKSKLTMEEDLTQTIALYDTKEALVQKVTLEMQALTDAEKANTVEGQNKLKELEKARAERDKTKMSIASISTELIKVRSNIDGTTVEGKEALKLIDSAIAKSQGTMKSISGIDDATQGTISAMESLVGQFDNVNEVYEEYREQLEDSIKATEDYRDILEELESTEGLSAQSKENIILKHKELLPYLEDEQELRRQLIEIIETEEEAQRVAYENMMMYSEDFFDSKIRGNAILVEKLGEYYDADLENAKSLAEAKAMVEAKLIDNLASQWARFYQINAEEGLVQTMGQGGLIDERGKNMMIGLANESNRIAGMFRNIIGSFGTPDFGGISRSKRAPASSKAKGGSGGSKGSSKKEAEIKLVEADAYEKVNFEIEKQNNLLARNKIYQDLARDDIGKKTELMRGEIKILKDQQTNYKELERIQLAQMKNLEGKLAKQGFTFKGEGADRVIADLGKIDGKTEDVKKIFDEYIKLQNSELPKTRIEWEKLGLSIGDVEKSITSLFTAQLDKRLDASRHYIEQRQHFEDWGEDSEIKALGRMREYLDQYYYDGTIEHRKYMEEVMAIDKELITAHEKVYDEAQKQREELRQQHIKTLNEELEEKRTMLAAVEKVEDGIVRIIQKRGEKERAALQETHAEEKRLLQERLTSIQKSYDDELDSFRKMIQAKLDALDDQYDEADYIESLNKEREKTGDIQRQIDTLSLDNSLTARNKVIQLRKDLADQNERIAKMQSDRERKILRESLQDQLKDKEASVKDERKVKEDEIKQEENDLDKKYKARQDFLDWRYSNEQIYTEAARVMSEDRIEYVNGEVLDMTTALQRFENEFGRGMGVMGASIRDSLISEVSNAKRAMAELRDEWGRFTKIRDNYDSDAKFSDKEIGWTDPGYKKYTPVTPVKKEAAPAHLGYGAATGKAAAANETKLNTDKAYTQSEIKRTIDVIAARKAAGLDTSVQSAYYKRLIYGHYASGGKITDTGLTLNQFHGTKQKPEWIFNDSQLKQVLERTTATAISNIIPKSRRMEQVGGQNAGNFNIENLINIEGNVDKKVVPEIKRAGNEIADIIKNLNKNGIFREVRM